MHTVLGVDSSALHSTFSSVIVAKLGSYRIALIKSLDRLVVCEILLKQGRIVKDIAPVDLADPFQFSQIRTPIARPCVASVHSQPVDSVMHMVPEARKQVIAPLTVKRAALVGNNVRDSPL